jgi:hypothetical protein
MTFELVFEGAGLCGEVVDVVLNETHFLVEFYVAGLVVFVVELET